MAERGAEERFAPSDEDLRGLLARMIAADGFAPSLERLAEAAARDPASVELALRRLGDARALLLHPGTSRPWIVHPFALSPAACWVETPRRGYWASCLYCAFGVAAALGTNATIATRWAGEEKPARFSIVDGAVAEKTGVFHLSTPVARWWDNVVYACASFQPFEREADIDDWCSRHAMPRGEVLSMDALWRFASDWYGGALAKPWRKRSPEEVRALFARHGLVGPFWSLS